MEFADGKTLTGHLDFDALTGGGWGELLGYDILWSTGREVFSDTVMQGSINLVLDNLLLSFSPHEWVKVADALAAPRQYGTEPRSDVPLGTQVTFYSGGMCGCGTAELILPPNPTTYYLDNAGYGYIEATAYPYGAEPSIVPEPDTAVILLLPLLGLLLIDFKRDRRPPSELRLP
jgi:hypothetical protein